MNLDLEVDNIDESVDYFKYHGIEVENIRTDEITGKCFTFFLDPDKLPLAIYKI
ncbi:VOC family protein [Trichodesmium erythraeum]|uniref:VOC family protein n=1 Tax=Trichodesmium erythraeum TaxID=1206 RepID=UPI00351BA296